MEFSPSRFLTNARNALGTSYSLALSLAFSRSLPRTPWSLSGTALCFLLASLVLYAAPENFITYTRSQSSLKNNSPWATRVSFVIWLPIEREKDSVCEYKNWCEQKKKTWNRSTPNENCVVVWNKTHNANSAFTEGLDPNQAAMCSVKLRMFFALCNMFHRSSVWINHDGRYRISDVKFSFMSFVSLGIFLYVSFTFFKQLVITNLFGLTEMSLILPQTCLCWQRCDVLVFFKCVNVSYWSFK